MKALNIYLLIVLLAIAMIAGVSFAQDAAPKEAPLKVAGFEGKVQVKISPSTEWADAVVDQALNQSDAVKTGDDGQAMLLFSDKSSVAIKPNTEIIVEELIWNDKARKAGLKMPIGELRAIIKKLDSPSDFKVATPTAICGARGTVFYIMTTGTETRVFVTEGAIDFTNSTSGNTYVVVQNMAAISDISGSVTEPRELTGTEKEQALAGWSGVIAETYIEPPAGGPPSGEPDPNAGPDLNGPDTDIGSTPENPGQENKGQQEQEASPV
jgi:hypothetical protein